MPINDPPPQGLIRCWPPMTTARDAYRVLEGNAREVCENQPASDLVGQPCSLCSHTAHYGGACWTCMLDNRIARIDLLIDQIQTRLQELDRAAREKGLT